MAFWNDSFASRPRPSARNDQARWFQVNPSALSKSEALIHSGRAASGWPPSRSARASLASGIGGRRRSGPAGSATLATSRRTGPEGRRRRNRCAVCSTSAANQEAGERRPGQAARRAMKVFIRERARRFAGGTAPVDGRRGRGRPRARRRRPKAARRRGAWGMARRSRRLRAVDRDRPRRRPYPSSARHRRRSLQAVHTGGLWALAAAISALTSRYSPFSLRDSRTSRSFEISVARTAAPRSFAEVA